MGGGKVGGELLDGGSVESEKCGDGGVECEGWEGMLVDEGGGGER